MDLINCIHSLVPRGFIVDLVSTGSECFHPDLQIWRTMPANPNNLSIALIVDRAEDYLEYLRPYSGTTHTYGIIRLYCLQPSSRISAAFTTQFVNCNLIYTCYVNPTLMPEGYSVPEEKILRYHHDAFQEHNIFGLAMETAMHYKRDMIILPIHLAKATKLPRYQVRFNHDYVEVHGTFRIRFSNWFKAKDALEWQTHFAQLYYQSRMPYGCKVSTIGFRLYDIAIDGVEHYGIFSANQGVSLLNDKKRFFLNADTKQSIMVLGKTITTSRFRTNVPLAELTDEKVGKPLHSSMALNPLLLQYLYKRYGSTHQYQYEIYKYLNQFPSWYADVIASAEKIDQTLTINLADALGMNTGMCWSMAPQFYHYINKHFGPALECFGSRWNHTLPDYCSLQFEGDPDDSIGTDFFHLRSTMRWKTLIVNPPYEEQVLMQAAVTVRRLCTLSPNLIVFFCMARWHDLAAKIKDIMGREQTELLDFPRSVVYSFHKQKRIAKNQLLILLIYNYKSIPSTMVAKMLQPIQAGSENVS